MRSSDREREVESLVREQQCGGQQTSQPTMGARRQWKNISKYDEGNGHLKIVSLGKLSRKGTKQSLFTDKQKLSLLLQTDCKRTSKGCTLLQKEGSEGDTRFKKKRTTESV